MTTGNDWRRCAKYFALALACTAILAARPAYAQSYKAELISPAAGSTLTSDTVEFRWTGGIDVLQYWLNVGTAPGSFDLVNVGGGHNLSAIATNLPADGRTLYARLHSHVNGHWEYNDYTLKASTGVPAMAELISPAPSSTLTTSAVEFRWTGGINVMRYWLNVGTTPGAFDLAILDSGKNLSVVATDLPTNGSTLYVRLYSHLGGVWQFRDYTLKAAASSLVTSGPAELIEPTRLSTLTSTAITVKWTGGSKTTQFRVTVGTHFGFADLWSEDVGNRTNTVVTGLPTNGHPIWIGIQYSDDNVTWHGYDSEVQSMSLGSPPERAELIGPLPIATQLGVATSSAQRFKWTGGINASDFHFALYEHFGSGRLMYDSAPGQRLATDAYGLEDTFMFTAFGFQQRGVFDYGPPFELYLRLLGKGTTLPTKAELMTPAPGSTLTSTSTLFEWSGGGAVTGYRLDVGNSPGGSDLFGRDMGRSLSADVPSLPADGRTLYVRLHSMINSVWVHNDYAVTATSAPARPADLVSPAPSSTLTSTTVQFEWTGGVGPALYWLNVGTAPGRFDLANVNAGTSLSAFVAGLPIDGSTVYVRLFSHLGGSWQFRDYTLTAALWQPKTAEVYDPSPGSMVLDIATFKWTRGAGVEQYRLSLGTSPGATDIFDQDMGKALFGFVQNLPIAIPIHVRLHSRMGQTWTYSDSVVFGRTGPGFVRMLSPAPNSQLAGSPVTFTWAGTSDLAQYGLVIRDQSNGNVILNQNVGLETSITAAVPTDGRFLSVELHHLRFSQWLIETFNFQTGSAASLAQLTSPAPGSTLSSANVTLQWTAATPGTISTPLYWLNIGSGPGTFDLANVNAGTNLSTAVSGLPTDGSTVFVRLFTNRNHAWEYIDYVLTASGDGWVVERRH